jgi:hypothetical protein
VALSPSNNKLNGWREYAYYPAKIFQTLITTVISIQIKSIDTFFWRRFAVASEMIFRRYFDIAWPARTFSRRNNPNPALSIPDFLTSSPGNRNGAAYFRGWPSKGCKTTPWQGKTMCTGSQKRTGGRPFRQVAIKACSSKQISGLENKEKL